MALFDGWSRGDRTALQRLADWQDEAHFFGVAALVMRRILVGGFT